MVKENTLDSVVSPREVKAQPMDFTFVKLKEISLLNKVLPEYGSILI